MKANQTFAALLGSAVLLAACATPTPPPTPVPPTRAPATAVPPTAVPVPTAVPPTTAPAAVPPTAAAAAPTAVPPTAAPTAIPATATPAAPKELVVDKSKLAKNLAIYSWSNYFSEEIIKGFEKEYGVKIKYDAFEQNEEMYAKFKAGGNPGYDIIVPSDYMVAKMIGEKLVDTIDLNNVPNIANIDPYFRKLPFDPEGKYSIAHFWGTTGFAYDTSKIKRELTSWKDILEPADDVKGKIAMLADPREALSAALRYKGFSANTTDVKHVEEAKNLLVAQKKSVKAYQDSPDNAKLLGNGQVVLAQVYVGDAIQIAREKPSIKYVIPTDVSTVFVDNLMIPKGAKAKYTAEVFFNYVLDVKRSANNANENGFPSPNAAAIKAGLIDKNLLSNPAIYPDLAKMAKALELLAEQDPKIEEAFDKAWTAIGVK